MRSIKTTSGAEIMLDGDLLAVLEALYHEITARKEFFLELRTPTVLQTGDRMKVSARVHHLADLKEGTKSRTVTLTLIAVAGRDRHEETKKVTFTGKEIRAAAKQHIARGSSAKRHS